MTQEKDIIVFRLRVNLNTLGMRALQIKSDDTYIIATLDRVPTEDLVENILKDFFHTDHLRIKDADKLVYAEGNTLYVRHKFALQFEEVFKALNLLNRMPYACSFGKEAIDFTYSRSQQSLDFEQLMIIQDFINPGRILTDNLFVIGMFDEYTMYVKLNSEAA